jgi:propanol-preferring alcohol dehydrogenase
MSPVPVLNYEKHLYYEKTVKSVTANTRRDGEEFLELASAVPVQTRVVDRSLWEANKALVDLKAGAINGAAVLVP